MSVWTVSQVLGAAHADNQALQNEDAWYRERQAEHQADLAALDARVAEAWEHLCAVLVPDLEPERLGALAWQLGLPAVRAAAVEAGTTQEVARQQAELAAVEADAEYQNREGIALECKLLLAECQELLAPLEAVYAEVVADPRFDRLRSLGYGTPRYAGRWWSLSFYRDWKEGDELVEAFGPERKADDFPALLHKVEEAETAARTLLDERDQLRARDQRISRLVERHDDAARALEQMPQRRLTAVRGTVRAHLQDLDEARLVALVGDAHAHAVAVQRLAGLAAQRRYLVAAAQRYIEEPRAQVGAAILRNNRDLQKLSRPKNAHHTFDAAKMHKRFVARPAAFSKRRERYAETRATIVGFDGYDRGSVARDFLWWDLMSDGRLDGDFIPEVASHRQRYPDTDHAHAVAAVAQRDDTGDALLIHDGS